MASCAWGDIGRGEAIAIELAMLCADAFNLHDPHLLLHSNNEGVIGALHCGHSCNFMVNQCVRRSDIVGMARNLSFPSFTSLPRTIWLTPSRVELGFQVGLSSLPAFLCQMPLNPFLSMLVNAVPSSSTLVGEMAGAGDLAALDRGMLISLPCSAVRPVLLPWPCFSNSSVSSPFVL